MTDWSVRPIMPAMSSTRDILIDKATELFIGRGYGVVGTAELCTSAGVNKGTFYHFFPSKSDLLIASIERYADALAAEFDAIRELDMPAAQKLLRLFEVPASRNRAWQAEHGFAQGCLVGNMSLELGAIDQKVRAAVQDAFARWVSPIAGVVDQLVDEGDLGSVDRRAAAEALIALIQGGLLLAKVHNDPSRVTLLARGALMHLRGLCS